MKTLLLTLIFTQTLFANILVIGDSHTAGPFGSFLHDDLVEKFPRETVVTLGHSSAAPTHWWSSNRVRLDDGVSHHLSSNGINQRFSIPWRAHRLYPVPKLRNLLKNMLHQRSWRRAIGHEITPDVVVFALGANDRRIISTNNGEPTRSYPDRRQIISDMVSEVKGMGLRCIWIAPPHSITRPLAVGDLTYQYIVEAVKERCPIYDSRKYVARYCDRVHFNCRRAIPTARRWAGEVADFVKDNL